MTVSKQLSFVDWIRFCRFINKSSSKHSIQLKKKKDQTFAALCSKINGDLKLQHTNIINLAGITPTQARKDILCHGLRFGIPLKIIKEEVQAEFELYYQQLLSSSPRSIEKKQECRATLSEITHRFTRSGIDKTGYMGMREH